MRGRSATITLVVAALATTGGCGDDSGGVAPTTVPTAPTTVPTSSASGAAPPESIATDPPPPESIAPDGDPTQARVGLEELVVLEAPIDATVAGNGELWVAQRKGTVRVVDPADGTVGDTIVDLSAETTTDAERGLLGIATDGDHLYVDFTDAAGNTRVDAFTLDDEGRPGARHPLLEVEQPFPNHNGGGLAIGPDRLLYVGLGDGGAANDPLGAGQDPTQLLGSILRIRPTPGATTPYEIPADNPFADGIGGRPEIFLIGVRNPWRFSFDPQTDDLWVADVGQNEIEEIDLLPGATGWGRGANLGWNLREGTAEFTGPRPEGNVDPVFEYRHGGANPSGCSVSGGRVYRGAAIPDLVGSYVFGDFCTGRLWAVSTAGGTVTFADLDTPVPSLVVVTEDPDGELLAVSLGGSIARVVPR